MCFDVRNCLKLNLQIMEEPKRLYRSESDKMIGGVCGGIAEYFTLDPTLVRLGYIVLSVFTVFSGVIAYFVLWIIVPKRKRLMP